MSITYELAKELRDAGFPRTVEIGSRYWITGGYNDFWDREIGELCGIIDHGKPVLITLQDRHIQPLKAQLFDNEHTPYGATVDEVFVPTLSQLIKECWEQFEGLELGSVELDNRILRWLSYSQGKNFYGEGATPEEAVARLYLALNKKP